MTKEELANEYVTRNGNPSTCMIGKAEYEAFLAGLNTQEGIDKVKAHDLMEKLTDWFDEFLSVTDLSWKEQKAFYQEFEKLFEE